MGWTIQSAWQDNSRDCSSKFVRIFNPWQPKSARWSLLFIHNSNYNQQKDENHFELVSLGKSTVGRYCSINEGRVKNNDLTKIVQNWIWIWSGDDWHCWRIDWTCVRISPEWCKGKKSHHSLCTVYFSRRVCWSNFRRNNRRFRSNEMHGRFSRLISPDFDRRTILIHFERSNTMKSNFSLYQNRIDFSLPFAWNSPWNKSLRTTFSPTNKQFLLNLDAILLLSR